jgi:3-phenylpropionate/trans-cinnamate dioxygenase ferredoxin reductase subunit
MNRLINSTPHKLEAEAPCYVIVGAGQAGAQAAITFREQGFSGKLVMVGEEPQAPYMRPPLSKKFLSKDLCEERLFLRPLSFYAENQIDLRTRTKVNSIDRERKTLHFQDGQTLPYDKLLLATGCRPRELSLNGRVHPDIFYLRTMDESKALQSRLACTKHLVVIGGGYLGLEIAATAALAGVKVTVLERGKRLLDRVTTSVISQYIHDAHVKHGVKIQCEMTVTGLTFDQDRLKSVDCDGLSFPADMTVIGVGAVPNDEIAKQAGLTCDDGILVDESAQTSDPLIFAAGDCARHPNVLFSCLVRLESVQNAVDQATVAAMNMMGHKAIYRRVPWFWSNQYDLKLQSAGLFAGHDETREHGDKSKGSFALLYYREGTLIGVDAINSPAHYLTARKSIGASGELAVRLRNANSPTSQIPTQTTQS